MLSGGLIADRRTHLNLLSKNGLCTAMWEYQLEVRQVEEQLRKVQEQDVQSVVTRGVTAG